MRWFREYQDQAFLVGLFVFALVVVLAVWGPESKEDVIQRERGMAVDQCEKVIKGALKAPSTAKLNLEAIGEGPKYSVTGTLDAQNSFGAMLRKTVRCNVVVRKDGKSVTVTEYSGLG